MTTTKSLQEALKEVLKDDDKVSKYEARVLRELILADGKVSEDEKRFLHQALEKGHLDEEAFRILSDLLKRAEMK